MFALIYCLTHAVYASIQAFIACNTVLIMKRNTPVSLSVYCIVIVQFGLIFDNLVRAVSPLILNQQDAADTLVWLVRQGTCFSYLLHGTTVSILFAAAYHLLDRLVTP